MFSFTLHPEKAPGSMVTSPAFFSMWLHRCENSHAKNQRNHEGTAVQTQPMQHASKTEILLCPSPPSRTDVLTTNIAPPQQHTHVWMAAFCATSYAQIKYGQPLECIRLEGGQLVVVLDIPAGGNKHHKRRVQFEGPKNGQTCGEALIRI